MTVDEMSACSRALSIVRNRCKVINHMLGYGDGLSKSPCKCGMDWGRYVVTYCDAVICEFSQYEIADIEKAINKLDGVCDGLWYGLGGGVVDLNVR